MQAFLGTAGQCDNYGILYTVHRSIESIPTMAIRRHTLRAQVRDELVQWLANGRLRPGERLEETRLARALGVSRTPLREALTGMAEDGLVESVPNRGFRVPGLALTVVQDLYPMLGALEGLALRLAGARARDQVPRLQEINARMASEHLTARQRYQLDRAWHETVTERNPNQSLAAELTRLRQRVGHYGGAWEQSVADVRSSQAEHAEITARIAAGALDVAAERLLAHWTRGIRVVAGWLAAREAAAAASPPD
jgi:DNA-binding GntR family transcriptional regulator